MKLIASSEIKKRSIKQEGIISLSQGITEYAFDDEIKNLLIKCIKDESAIFSYTEQSGIKQLREYIAKWFSDKLRRNVDKDNILVTNGAITALACVFLTLLNPNDEVILLSPYYPSFIEQITLACGKEIIISTKERKQLVENIKKKISQNTKAIIINCPSNPAGMLLDKNEFQQIAELCYNNKIFLISDETYADLLYDNDDDDFARNIFQQYAQEYYIAINSFSKSLGISGMRIGFIYAEKTIITEIAKANDAISICAPALSQYFLLQLFENDLLVSLMKKIKNELIERRDILCSQLDLLHELFSYKKPIGGLYVFAELTKNENDIFFCDNLLQTTKVSLVPGSAFGEDGKGYIRISFGAKKEVIIEAMDRIVDCYKNPSKNI
ncbi:pyridoxal phosphate-dependent aminotransferase [Candidatus Woesearchaeota archaeon]|nr:pyridoxal phosphate-dependent aminotransferase [Candidatus Woesearchaeota archaeon]